MSSNYWAFREGLEDSTLEVPEETQSRLTRAFEERVLGELTLEQYLHGLVDAEGEVKSGPVSQIARYMIAIADDEEYFKSRRYLDRQHTMMHLAAMNGVGYLVSDSEREMVLRHALYVVSVELFAETLINNHIAMLEFEASLEG